jgi:hypothetical protein
VKKFPPPLRPPPQSLFTERSPIPRAPVIQQSKSLVDESSRLTKWAPIERAAHLQSLFYLSFSVLSMGAFPPGPLHRAPTERDAPTSEPRSTIPESPWKKPHEERCLSPQPSIHNPQGP